MWHTYCFHFHTLNYWPMKKRILIFIEFLTFISDLELIA